MPVRMQEKEVALRLEEENKLAGIEPVYLEHVNLPEGFLDTLFEGNEEDSFSCFNNLRKSRNNILSLTIDRTNGISFERARTSNDVKRVGGQCRDLLYGTTNDSQVVWRSIKRTEVASIKIDVRNPYVSAVKSATI